MRYIGNASSIVVNDDFEVDVIYQFAEDDDRVIISTQKFVDEFERGFICDMKVKFEILNVEGSADEEYKYMETYLDDLLLIRINKYSSVDGIALFDYVFLKH